MTTRRFALLFGVVFLLVGIAGFIPLLMTEMHPEHPDLILDANAGQLLGLFPVNLLHNAVHLLFGLWGVVASRSTGAAKTYGKGVAIIYLVLTLAGSIPGLLNGFGFVPLYGNDIWLHALLALVAACFGWLHRDTVTTTSV